MIAVVTTGRGEDVKIKVFEGVRAFEFSRSLVRFKPAQGPELRWSEFTACSILTESGEMLVEYKAPET